MRELRMRPLALSILAAALLLGSHAALAERKCPVGTKYVGDYSEQRGNTTVVGPNCETMNVSELDAELDQLGQRIATSRASLARNAVRGGKLQGDIDEWVKLGNDAQADAENAILAAAASFGLSWL